jgi:hypothetical protein
MSKPPSTADKLIKRVFQRSPDPVQRPRTCPPQQLVEKLSQEKGISEKRMHGRVSPLTRTVKVPISSTMEFRGSGEKKRRPPPPPLSTTTSARPSFATNPAMTGLQSEDDRRRPTSLPVSPRNEGFRYPGSDLARRRPSLRTPARRYEDDLPVFNNGIGGGPIQRYPILEDRYPPLLPGPPTSPPTSPMSSFSRPYNAADAQQQPKRTGRPEQYSYSRNL